MLVPGVVCHLCRFLGCMMPMVSMLCGMISDRRVNGLRRSFLGKGHYRTVAKTHNAEQDGDDGPEYWAESP